VEQFSSFFRWTSGRTFRCWQTDIRLAVVQDQRTTTAPLEYVFLSFCLSVSPPLPNSLSLSPPVAPLFRFAILSFCVSCCFFPPSLPPSSMRQPLELYHQSSFCCFPLLVFVHFSFLISLLRTFGKAVPNFSETLDKAEASTIFNVIDQSVCDFTFRNFCGSCGR
jgi:hypothetical protein